MKPNKKALSTAIKLIVTVILLYLVFSKINFSDVFVVLKTSKLSYLGLAVLFFILSQWLSAKRLLIFFKEVKCNLSATSNIKLYLIGMFYNFFIPGGIGGDAYKVYILNKEFNWKVKTLSKAILIDRFSGLVAIGILISLLFIKLNLPNTNLVVLAIIAAFLIILTGFYIIKFMFNSFKGVYFKTLGLSIIIQGAQLICIALLLMALGHSLNVFDYLLVFLISSILSIFSFAGIGVREAVFYKAAIYLNYNATIAVTISLLFSIITAIVSLAGIILHFNKTKFNINED